MQIKGKKKTAWSGVYYNEDGHESDITGWEVMLPDETKIPQLRGRTHTSTWERICGREERREV
eukprot:1242378-Pleurochrysis_carterae.AAC.1